jgi:hypothetical protein
VVIRPNLQPSKVAPTQQKVPATETRPQVKLEDLTAQVDAALKNGIFSEDEAKRLGDALKGAPEHKSAVAAHLTKQLEAGEKGAITVTDTTLAKLSGVLGADFKGLFGTRQAQSAVVDRELNSGLDKTAKSTADEHDAGKHRDASETRLANQKALRDSHDGVKGRPIGGLKGAAYDAALQYAPVLEGKLDEKLSPEAKAFKDQVREPLVKTCGQCVTEVTRNPETMKSLGEIGTAISKGGLKDALTTAASNVGMDIVNATKMAEVNVDAVNATVSGVSSAAQRLVDVTKGTKVGEVLAQKAPGVVKTFTDLGAKVTSGANAAAGAVKGAEVAVDVAKGAKVVGDAANVAKGAQAVATGAQVAGAGAKASAQAVPGLNVAVGVVTTGLATAEFVGDCAHKPRDWKRIALSGAALVGQAVGIFIPFVGAATTVAKLGGDAALNAHDKKHGRESAPKWGAGDIAPSVAQATSFAAPFLESAGYGDAAAKLKNVNAKVEHLAQHGPTAAEFNALPQAEREAMVSNLMAAQAESEKLAEEAKGTKHEPAMRLLGEAFKGILSAWRKSKNVDMAEDPNAEKQKLHGEAMEAAAKATTAQAMVDAGIDEKK